ncbi:hypothetical protein AB205_0153780 [Aquarana catesbeiana]|uniref:Uncharacterized protein n=1 Tax=Aquarana catesbeiana TaxID=8400 RepID=A0A2G9S0S2_AQUCT|nr:hypothetical protein AB205_0153780 [Aquarana catesbeiana]
MNCVRNSCGRRISCTSTRTITPCCRNHRRKRVNSVPNSWLIRSVNMKRALGSCSWQAKIR